MSDQTPQALPPEILGFPLWIKLTAAAVGLLVVISVVRVGSVFGDAISVERAHRHIEGGQYALAAKEIGPVARHYPESADFVLDLVQAELGANDFPNAVQDLTKLQGKMLDDAQTARANSYADQLETEAKKRGLIEK